MKRSIVFFLTLLIGLSLLQSCSSHGRSTIVDKSGSTPDWINKSSIWTEKGTVYISGYVTDVDDRAIGERQAYLNACSNLATSIKSIVRTEMQSVSVGDNTVEQGIDHSFRATDGLSTGNISIAGTILDSRYYQRMATRIGRKYTRYSYDCYVLLRMDEIAYETLVDEAKKKAQTSIPTSASTLLDRVQNATNK